MNSESPLCSFLRQRAASIAQLETDAHAALYDRKDEVAYRKIMEQKARLLSSIADDAAPFLAEEKQTVLTRKDIEARLAGFAGGARAALKLGSVFYMSALLYPDEYKQGEPNNLERLIGELANP
jgi:hypothetical protein